MCSGILGRKKKSSSNYLSLINQLAPVKSLLHLLQSGTFPTLDSFTSMFSKFANYGSDNMENEPNYSVKEVDLEPPRCLRLWTQKLVHEHGGWQSKCSSDLAF